MKKYLTWYFSFLHLHLRIDRARSIINEIPELVGVLLQLALFKSSFYSRIRIKLAVKA